MHIGQLLLEKLRLCQWFAELLAVQPVLTRGVPARLCGAHHTPGNAIARPVQAAKRPFQALHTGQKRIFADRDRVHHDFTCDRGAQAEFAADFRRGKAFHALFEHKTPNFAAVGFGFCPDYKDIRDGGIADPHLRPADHIAVGCLFGCGFHARRITACIGFGQAKTTNQSSCRQTGQVFLALDVAAIGVDRVHDQGRLHRHHRPIAAIHTLNLAGDQTVGDIARTQPAIFLGDGQTQKASRAHFGKDARINRGFAVGVGHARLQCALCKGVGCIAQHPLVFGQLVFEA